MGEQTHNFDGTVRFIFVNEHNITKYPVIDMLFNGKKIGIFAAARHLITIKGKKLCPDTTCAAVDGAHKLSCKLAQQIEKQRTINRSHAVGKSFESILAGNRTRANEIRLAMVSL